MGCDIHFNIEKQTASGKWRSAQPKDLYLGRNYMLFGYLAGVRGNAKPLFPPRGFPSDASTKVKSNFEQWSSDAHTPSYLTLAELIEVGNVPVDYPVYLHPGDYKKYKDGQNNANFYTSIFSSTIEISNEEMERRINLLCFDDDADIVTAINDLKVSVLLPTFLNVISEMKKLNSDYSKVRAVFWFDN